MRVECKVISLDGEEEIELPPIPRGAHARFPNYPMRIPTFVFVNHPEEIEQAQIFSMPRGEFQRRQQAGTAIAEILSNSYLVAAVASGEEYRYPLTSRAGLEAATLIVINNP